MIGRKLSHCEVLEKIGEGGMGILYRSRDYGNPVEESQKVMFDLLGTPDEHKRHAVFDSGHLPHRNDMIRETLDWLDRHLGAVQR
jgi:hypothetical protein